MGGETELISSEGASCRNKTTNSTTFAFPQWAETRNPQAFVVDSPLNRSIHGQLEIDSDSHVLGKEQIQTAKSFCLRKLRPTCMFLPTRFATVRPNKPLVEKFPRVDFQATIQMQNSDSQPSPLRLTFPKAFTSQNTSDSLRHVYLVLLRPKNSCAPHIRVGSYRNNCVIELAESWLALRH